MGQLTLSRFRGDTTFGLVARVFSTFFGGLVGTVIWCAPLIFTYARARLDVQPRYISTGAGSGNPYGLAVVCAVCFPFFFYGRLYWPGPPMFNLIVSLSIHPLLPLLTPLCRLFHKTVLRHSRLGASRLRHE